MIRVKMTTCFPEWPLERQTPGKSGKWGECIYLINKPVPECDWWVVYEDLISPETAACPAGHTMLITAEPPSLKKYDPAFLNQFGMVITCHPNLDHPNVILMQQALPWHIGRRTKGHANLGFGLEYDQLRSLPPPPKTKCMSVICSGKAVTKGHRARLAFIQRLVEHFKEQLDAFGRGVKDIEDKWIALADYRYHIVLENSSVRHYWTEKLADAFLGWTYPIYFGCPNLGDYFPAEAFLSIDIEDPHTSIQKIEQTVARQTYERKQHQISQSRSLVLDRYNLFAILAVHCSAESTRAYETVNLQPQASFLHKRSVFKRVCAKVARWGF
ncbi:glycosyltransferase family 10 [Nitrospiraceae bacterium AH_259_D15_M11_P09]|nr:glycosyltransferase family 10 [Nitrospiraceae bacterium AH_259_D15_M11_P09]